MQPIGKYKILKPIFQGNDEYNINTKIGIAEFRLLNFKPLEIEILYTDKRGNRLFPYIYSITKKKALTYPLQIVKGVRLRIIPVKDLDIICRA